VLGRTARGLFWMFRYLERSENTARLVDAGFRIALTRFDAAADEWASVVETSGVKDQYLSHHDQYDANSVVDFLLRDKSNPSSVLSVVDAARNDARMVRASLTREVWEATNNCWMTLKSALARPVRERELPEVLDAIRKQSAQVRGALHGTMLRNDIFNFARLGTFLERADSTARILDVKYYVLLPSAQYVGSSLDNVQWETVLRSVSAMRSYRWLYKGEISPKGIADFLIMDHRMPRSLAFCYAKIEDNLGYLFNDYGAKMPCHHLADTIYARLKNQNIDAVFDFGLHEFIEEFLRDNAALYRQIERDFRFYE
jgi:uncharacterized alpha-E superfamily protein